LDIVTNVFELKEKEDKVRSQEEITVNRIVRRFETYKDKLSTSLYRPQWIKNYKLWRSYIDTINYPHRSKLFIPLTFQYIETVLPRVSSNKVTIAVAARRQADMQYVEPLNKKMAWNVERNRLNSKWGTFSKQLIMQGYSPAYAFWNVDKYTGFPYPDFEPIDLFNLFVDPEAFPKIESAPEVIIRVSTMLGMLDAKVKMGLYEKGKVDKVRETSSPYGDIKEPVIERHEAIGAGYDEEPAVDQWKKVELLLHITPFKTTVIANRKIILREQDNFGILPIVGCHWTEDPFHMFGLGQIEPSQYLQHAINGTSNQLFDQRSLALRGVTLVGTANATVEDSKFQRKAGAIIRVTDVNQVRDHHSADVSGGIGEERMFYLGQMQETHSAMDIIRGASGADETATQAQINNAAIETKLSAPTRNMEEAIKQLAMIWHGMDQKYMTPQTLMALGYEDQTFPAGISPQAFAAQVNFTPIIEPQAPLTKQFKRRNMQEAIGGLLGMPGFPELMSSNPMLQARIYTIALRHFDMDEGPELIQNIQQAIMMKMQAMSAPQLPPPGNPGGAGSMPMPPGGPPPQGPPMPMPGPQGAPAPQGLDAAATLLGQMSDEEIVSLMSAPPEQVAQVLFALEQQQMQGRPQQMPAMQPAVTTQGVL